MQTTIASATANSRMFLILKRKQRPASYMSEKRSCKGAGTTLMHGKRHTSTGINPSKIITGLLMPDRYRLELPINRATPLPLKLYERSLILSLAVYRLSFSTALFRNTSVKLVK